MIRSRVGDGMGVTYYMTRKQTAELREKKLIKTTSENKDRRVVVVVVGHL
jgi:hypothetical protein